MTSSHATAASKNRARPCRFTEALALLDDDKREIVAIIVGDHSDQLVGEALTSMAREINPEFPAVRRRTVNSHRRADCSCDEL